MRYSKQRESIKEYLQSVYTHPTAEEVHTNLLLSMPNLSLGTVYRNLSSLSDNNEIKKIITSSGIYRYDGNTMPHSHFICSKCGKVSDIPIKDSIINKDLINTYKGGTIDNIEINLLGVCNNCK